MLLEHVRPHELHNQIPPIEHHVQPTYNLSNVPRVVCKVHPLTICHAFKLQQLVPTELATLWLHRGEPSNQSIDRDEEILSEK